MNPTASSMHLFLAVLALSGAIAAADSSWGAVDAPPAGASAAEAPSAQPSSLRFDPPTLDLGEMIAGQPKTATLTVTNTSDAAVTIASMKGGCGCTTLSAHPPEPVSAGASFSVEVTVDPGMRTGISLRKPVYVKLADGRVETMHVVGRVKTVIAVTPDQVEAVGSVAGATASVTLASVDGAPFTVTGAAPSGIVTTPQPTGASSRIELALDLEAWERAGRPSTVLLSTDRADARQVAIPVKFADAVAMFRLPAAGLGSRQDESAQDALVREIDARISAKSRSEQFRMRLHRESGMLFVHGTASDLDAVRAVVRSLPPSSGVRESVSPPKG
jgi:hypothetical protein